MVTLESFLAMKKDSNRSHPLYLHALALGNLSQAIAGYVDYQYETVNGSGFIHLQAEIAEAIRKDSQLIQKNTAEITRSGSYSRMGDNLRYLRTLGKNLLSYCNGLEFHGLKEREYVQLLRREVKLYRRALKHWPVSPN
jgi:hypothetical protein